MALHSSSANIVQVQRTLKGSRFATNSTSFTDISGLNCSITPKFANSKILIMCTMGACGTEANNGDNGPAIRVLRNVAGGGYSIFGGGVGDSDGSRMRITMKGTSWAYNHDHMPGGVGFTVMDDPSYSVGQTLNYKVQIMCQDSSVPFRLNGNGLNANNGAIHQARSCTNLVVQEIGQ
tara:strand:+ start:515 stop:1048 length:534 start_codon:yes stop_codon:yes gene_type:complete